jgi:hypothetical protein
MRIKRKAVLITGMMLALTGGAAMAVPASAGTVTQGPAVRKALPASHIQSVCLDNGPGTPCLNEWNGNGNNGNPIKMYAYNNTNEAWSFQDVDLCNSAHTDEGIATVTETCPFPLGSGLNTAYEGDPIVQILGPQGECLATTGSGTAVNGTCGETGSGQGASNGVFNVLVGNAPHCSQFYCSIVNRYWTNNRGVSQFVCSASTANGAAVILDNPSFSCAGSTAFWFGF